MKEQKSHSRVKFKGDRRPYKCPYQGCPRIYAVEDMLKRHIRTNHLHGKTEGD